MIFSGAASPSTPMELVKRLTAQAVTPSTPFTAFSTRALQAAQLMPVTSYCFIDILVSFDSMSIPRAFCPCQRPFPKRRGRFFRLLFFW